MSSLLRRIERQVLASQKVHPEVDQDGKPTGRLYANPPRTTCYMGRGSKLGVHNPKDAARLAREARDRKWGRDGTGTHARSA